MNNVDIEGGPVFLLTSSKGYLQEHGNQHTCEHFEQTVVVILMMFVCKLNNTIWSIWNVDEPNTDHVFFAEFNSTGPGVADAKRPSFSTVLTSSQAAVYNIASTVGSDYMTWVDATYLL